jgi:FkbM family methyltransferase
MNVIGATFEPATVLTLRALCDQGDHALDVGANIGLTALALSQYCGKVVGVEPVPKTFNYLSSNVAGVGNISIFKTALGNSEGEIRMQGNPDFLAGSFIADEYEIAGSDHFTESVPIKRLDSSMSHMGLNRLDFMKVDVEGFELEVFEGGRETLNDLRPIVYLEMNHWCLNVFRRISIPEFRERLLSVFPYVYAVDRGEYISYHDGENSHHINHEHIVHGKYANLVVGFDRDKILNKLEKLKATYPAPVVAQAQPVNPNDDRIEDLRRKLDEANALSQRLLEQNKALLESTSWKITAPLRAISSAVKH